MITIMNANEITPSCAIENGTFVDLAIMNVAAAVPGPQITRAAVPTNSAATLREKVTSAIRPAHNSRWHGSRGTSPPSEGTGWVRLCSVKPNSVSLSFRSDEGRVNRAGEVPPQRSRTPPRPAATARWGYHGRPTDDR